MYPKQSSRFSRKLDSLFWWVLRLLPVFFLLIFVLGCYKQNAFWEFFISDGDFTFLYDLGPSGIFTEFFLINSSNLIVVSINAIFGTEGTLLFCQPYSFLLLYFSYLVYIEIFHLLLDVIVFIPRLARKWINMACQDD